MPIDYRRYPANWKTVVKQLHERAGGRCEAMTGTGIPCEAQHKRWVHRCTENAEHWESCAADVDGDYQWCTGRDVDELFGHEMREEPVRIILTSAHTCDCDPPCADESHLLVLCQLHHLRLDSRVHAAHAAETRRQKKIQAGQGAML